MFKIKLEATYTVNQQLMVGVILIHIPKSLDRFSTEQTSVFIEYPTISKPEETSATSPRPKKG